MREIEVESIADCPHMCMKERMIPIFIYVYPSQLSRSSSLKASLSAPAKWDHPFVWTLKTWNLLMAAWTRHSFGAGHLSWPVQSYQALCIPWTLLIPKPFAVLRISKAASWLLYMPLAVLYVFLPLTIWWIPTSLWGQLKHHLLREARLGPLVELKHLSQQHCYLNRHVYVSSCPTRLWAHTGQGLVQSKPSV